MSNTQTEIRLISAEDTYPVRQPVLRPGRPAAECRFPGDHHEDSFHLGCFRNNKLVGIASYIPDENPQFRSKPQYRLRGMAVLPEVRKQNLGEKLLLEGEVLLKKRYDQLLLWFNARETAVDFYTRYGYQTKGDFFEVPNVCTHILMYKQL